MRLTKRSGTDACQMLRTKDSKEQPSRRHGTGARPGRPRSSHSLESRQVRVRPQRRGKRSRFRVANVDVVKAAAAIVTGGEEGESESKEAEGKQEALGGICFTLHLSHPCVVGHPYPLRILNVQQQEANTRTRTGNEQENGEKKKKKKKKKKTQIFFFLLASLRSA